jgi:sec-independent protein translocase protein TatA
MFGLRAPELLLIFAVLLLLFGATKLPALGSSLGSAIRNFKKGFGGEEEAAAEPPEKRNVHLASGTRTEPRDGTQAPSATPQGRKDV